MTKISFTDEHLRTILTALEVYSRLRAGQIKIAVDEAFRDYDLSYEESESIEKFVRNILFPEPPQLYYDGHGGYYDQYDNNYDENRNLIGELSYADKVRQKRPHLGGGYYGVTNEKMKDGQIAYEIYSTIRQYVALRENDGYYEIYTNYRDPLKVTEVPLPEIEGFSKEKKFPIKGKAIVNKLKKAEDTKDYSKVWDIVGEYLGRHYPELEGYDQARIETEDNHYVVLVKGARRKKS